jgi:hypothetical protein
MTELELTRSPDDRKVYVLEGVGTLRLDGWLSRGATAEAGGRSWRLGRRGFLRTQVEATEASGAVAGRYEPRGLRRGGTVRWGDRSYELRAASRWRERYALADGDRELALFDGKGWGKRPVRVSVADLDAVEPALLLFGAYVVRGLAEDASAAAGGAAAAGAAAASS